MTMSTVMVKTLEMVTVSMMATMVAMVVPEVMAATRLGIRLITRHKTACQNSWTAAWLMIAVNTRRWGDEHLTVFIVHTAS